MLAPASPDMLLPLLSSGRHRHPRQGACFMEFASFLAGERFSDHPACTHPALAQLARTVNDLMSDDRRSELLAVVHRVVGLTGDDPLVAAEVAVIAARSAMPVVSVDRQNALAAGLLTVESAVDDGSLRQQAVAALALAPASARWARRYRDHLGAALPSRVDAALDAIVRASVIGIALSCSDDPDSRLRDLLTEAIDATERRLGRRATPRRSVVQAVPALA